jgi:hypothetical protein
VDASRAKAKKARLKAFRSCTGLIRYARRHAPAPLPPATGPFPPPPPGAPPVPESGGGEDGAPVGGALPESRGGPVADDDSSGTNVQEEGIDEPDIVKSNGRTIFAVSGSNLHAIDARSHKPRIVRTLELTEGYGHQLLLSGDKLLVMSSGSGGYAPVRAATTLPYYYGYEPTTVLREIDVSDPSRMRTVRIQTVDGNLVSSRLNGDTARVVLSTPPRALTESDVRLRRRVSGWVPRGTLRRRGSSTRRTRVLASCRAVRHPAVFSGLEMITVLTIDLARGLPAVDADAVMSGGETVYASDKSLYVATQRYYDGFGDETGAPPRTTTAIHRFDISDPRETRYRSSGSVPGYMLNQFSMSEHDEFLRVATTDDPPWWDGADRAESQSFVTVLDDRSGALARVGQVGGLGRTERIYAVRFIGDKGFVVTFRQVDPLYTLDLSDPREPRVVGELKIPGYSAYLHPVGDDRLIGVGQDATDEGIRTGVQVSLFDVSDLARPKQLAKQTLGEHSTTDVEYDHHAFLWWAPERLAVIPLQEYSDAGPAFLGAVGIEVGTSRLAEVGRITQPLGGGYAPITRSLVVGDRLLTLSDAGMQSSALRGLGDTEFVAFPGGAAPPPGPEPAPVR